MTQMVLIVSQVMGLANRDRGIIARQRRAQHPQQQVQPPRSEACSLKLALLLCASVAAWSANVEPSLAQPPSLPSPGAMQAVGGIRDAAGGFMVTPHRLVFEARRRSAALTLINSGSDTASFRISLIRMRMSETGEFAVADSVQAGEAFADTLVRYSPRQVELAPGETQVIRLQLRKPADLPAGEYRSHLLMQAIPRTRVSDDPDTSRNGRSAGVQVRIVPVYGTAIPVIVRHGATAAEVSFSDFHYHTRDAGGPATASLVIHRQGNRSVYGDLSLSYLSERGAAQVMGVMKGVSVYSPNPTRIVRILLAPAAASLPARGLWLVSYANPAPDGQTIAESSFILP